MEKFDPYDSRKRLESWKKSEIKKVSEKNAKLIRQYVHDMEMGINTNGSKKGPRSPIKILSAARQITRIIELIEEKCNVLDVTKVHDTEVHEVFHGMVTGGIKKANGDHYKSAGDYAARFKAFWHWHMKVMKKLGTPIIDITEDLDASKRKNPEFVFFTEEDLNDMMEAADFDTRVFMLFLFDTGIRCPTEAMNIRVNDFTQDFKELHIRDEISKTFGRKIKLMMCSDAVKQYIDQNDLSGSDFVFTIQPATMNKRLKKIGHAVLGDKETTGRKAGKHMTMYDFRHSSACYWLPRYKSRNALLYRFGWKEEREIHYYTELLGMKDTISEDDMMINTTKTDMEKELEKNKKDIVKLKSMLLKVSKSLEKREQLDPVLDKLLKMPQVQEIIDR